MNVARKSTTKLPQSWPRSRTKNSETNSGVGSTDSTEFQDPVKDNFQEVLFNLKALNGTTDFPDCESPKKDDQKTVKDCAQKEDSNKNLAASPAKQNGEKECDVLDQIDSIVNDSKASDQRLRNGHPKEPGETASARESQHGDDEEEDVVMLLSEDDKTDTKEPQGPQEKDLPKEQQKDGQKDSAADAVPKEKSRAGAKKKHPLQIGAKVRNTVHSIMSKLVQSGNPELSSLITKTKSEDSQDSISSTAGDRSPLPAHHGKGNLFDNLDFDISERESKSPKAPLTKDEEGEQNVSQRNCKVSHTKEEMNIVQSQKQHDENKASTKMDTDDTERDEKPEVGDIKDVGDKDSSKEHSDAEKVDNLDEKDGDEAKKLDIVVEQKGTAVTEKTTATPDRLDMSSANEGDSMTNGQNEIDGGGVEMKDGVDKSENADSVNCDSGDSVKRTPCDVGVSSENSGDGLEPQSVSDCDDDANKSSAQKVASPITHADAEPMDTTDMPDSDKDSSKDFPAEKERPQCGDSVKQSDTERKRQHDGSPELDDSQIPKRSRLDEVIGKLGERVSIPSGAEENDSNDEDSVPGDSESAEKQSEDQNSEIASVSDDEEDTTTSVASAKILRLTNKELEALVRSKVKAYMAQQQVAELRTLRLRVVELQEAQEEWRKKAKDLERQVLDLTVLQQRLEKRKAHTAALRSITTRNFGVQVNEDKLRSNTPQKNASSKTLPAAAGGASAAAPTPPAVNMPTVLWSAPTQAIGQPPVLTNSVAGAPPSTKVTTITIGGTLSTRNTSVAQLLSQTARMPTAATVTPASTTKPAPVRAPNLALKTQGPTPVAVTRNHSLLEPQVAAGSATKALSQPAATAPTASSLMLVSAPTGIPVVSKGVASTAVSGQAIITGPPATTSTASTIKFIDLTMEDDAGASKTGKQMASTAGQVRGMVPQQVVRQISPLPQGVPATSTILLSSAAGTQIVGARPPGMYQFMPGQVVTIANAQQLRPGSLVTVVPGQPGIVRQTAPTSVSTVSRNPAQQILAQVPAGMTIVRPAVGVSTAVRPSSGPQSVSASTRTPVTLATVSASGAPAQDSSSTTASRPKLAHPAPPPIAVVRVVPGESKPPPPRPGLKISRVKQGIVLSWNMTLPSDCIEIASYQLYAYQETSAPPQTSLWKKVGDVKALPLPMACTLTQFQDGNKYHFAVRAVDKHGRTGLFSEPAFIFLSKSSS